MSVRLSSADPSISCGQWITQKLLTTYLCTPPSPNGKECCSNWSTKSGARMRLPSRRSGDAPEANAARARGLGTKLLVLRLIRFNGITLWNDNPDWSHGITSATMWHAPLAATGRNFQLTVVWSEFLPWPTENLAFCHDIVCISPTSIFSSFTATKFQVLINTWYLRLWSVWCTFRHLLRARNQRWDHSLLQHKLCRPIRWCTWADSRIWCRPNMDLCKCSPVNVARKT